MKNLIITIGILMLMITGIIYDLDCQNLMTTERRLKWACEEAAYGAAVSLWRKEETREEAEKTAKRILRRNLGLNEKMEPEENAEFLGPVILEMDMDEGRVYIRADCGEARLRLSFLKGYVHVQRQDHFDFSERFFGKRNETS